MPLTGIRRFLRNDYGTHRGYVRAMLAEMEFVLGRLGPFVRPELTQVERLVFVCRGNICRSSFADRFARGLGLRAASFGLDTNTGMPAFPLSLETAARFGVDLAEHRTTAVGDFRQSSMEARRSPEQHCFKYASMSRTLNPARFS